MTKKKKHSILDTIQGEVVSAAGNYYKDKVEKKIIKIGEFSVLALLGLILISFGLAELIGHYFKVLAHGFSYLFFGVILLIMAFIVKR